MKWLHRTTEAPDQSSVTPASEDAAHRAVGTHTWVQEQRRLSAEDQKVANAERRFSIGAVDGQSCETCRFWRGKRHLDGNWGLGWCIRRAPSYDKSYIYAESPYAHDFSNKHFPHTFHDDWCGDFIKASAVSGDRSASDATEMER